MRRMLQILVLAPALLLAPAAWAADQGTPDEAKVLAVKAAEYLKAVGPDKAFPEFDAKDNTAWHESDLYVTVVDSNGVAVAHGNSPGLIGKSVLDLKDVDGKSFIRDMQEIKDAGWVDYKWQNPLTKTVEPKTAYVVRVGDYVVAVGAYKQSQ